MINSLIILALIASSTQSEYFPSKACSEDPDTFSNTSLQHLASTYDYQKPTIR